MDFTDKCKKKKRKKSRYKYNLFSIMNTSFYCIIKVEKIKP